MELKTLAELPPWEWPEDTDEQLLEVLAERQAETNDRILAAKLAGDFVVVGDELVGALLSILGDEAEAEPLRAQAATSLGPALEHSDLEGFDDPDDVVISKEVFHSIQDRLTALFRDEAVPKDVRRRILETSVRAQQDWHQEAIGAAYASPDRSWKLSAVFAMGYVRGFDQQILEALEDESPEIRYYAIEAAGNWQVDAAWSRVVEETRPDNPDKDLLLAAIEATGFIRPQEAGAVLHELLDSDDEDVVEAAYEALAAAGLELDPPWDEDDEQVDGDDR